MKIGGRFVKGARLLPGDLVIAGRAYSCTWTDMFWLLISIDMHKERATSFAASVINYKVVFITQDGALKTTTMVFNDDEFKVIR